MNRLLAFFLIAFALLGPTPNLSVQGSTSEEIDAYLTSVDADYSREHNMLGMPFRSPGYHSQVADGVWVHPTRQSLDYAAALLSRNAAGDAARAADVIRKVISLQDRKPDNKTFGIWPWLLEEPLEQMSPPDWNWADFCGASIALMLHDHGDRLRPEATNEMRQSLSRAAQAIRKRNVQPGYTNIAIMGGVVCAAAGELLSDNDMLQYGRDRLQRTLAHTKHHGGFNEYNSPTYTMVSLWECERALHLVADAETRRAAEALRRIAWELVAGSYHPGTHQWAGPHSRAYSDLISSSLAKYLSAQTGVAIPPHPSKKRGGKPSPVKLFRHLPCPGDLRSRFGGPTSDNLQLRRTFLRGKTAADSIGGTTWLAGDACLGSVNRSSLWTQRRVLIGYWRTERDPAVVFRLRFLHDGQDFASMGVATSQEAGRTLSVFYPLRNKGDWHVSLDRPQDGVFRARDFRIRYELSGVGVRAESIDKQRFALRAGDQRAVIHALPGHFAGQAIRWETSVEHGIARVDGVCYQGPKAAFNFRTLRNVVLAAGVELVGQNDELASEAPRLTKTAVGNVTAVWNVGDVLTVDAKF